MELFILAIMWIVYFTIHSGMISNPVTNYLKLKLDSKFRFYRLFYNFISIVLLIPILFYSRGLKNTPFFDWPGYLLIVKYALVATSLLVFYLGAQRYSMMQFLGFTQIRTQRNHGLINKSGQLDTSGILGIIRHPFYAGVFPLIWASSLDITNLITNIIISIYVIVGTILEERKLILEFGDVYRQYQKEVSMFIPLKWIIKRLKKKLQ
ncbi:methyltransferase family protein [Bacteroidota bacterium]